MHIYETASVIYLWLIYITYTIVMMSDDNHMRILPIFYIIKM